MSIRSVACGDLLRTGRSRGVWILWSVFALLLAVLVYTYEGQLLTQAEEVRAMYRHLSLVVGILVPIIAIGASYTAITSEKETGGLRFLLSLPNSRRDVFAGKLGARLILVTTGLVFAFLVAASIAATVYSIVPLQVAVGLCVITVLYAAVFVSLGVSLSGASETKTQAIAASIGAYFFLVLLQVIPLFSLRRIVRAIHTGVLQAEPNTTLYDAVSHLSPYTAFRQATNLAFPAGQHVSVFETAGDVPVYLTSHLSIAILLVWIILPAIAGYVRFSRSDLA